MANEQKIQEAQIIEQKFQNLVLQKQAFQMELHETESALKEIESSGDEIFKIIGQIMLKADKAKTKQELLEKQKIIGLRINAIEKQEASLQKQLDSLRLELLNKQ